MRNLALGLVIAAFAVMEFFIGGTRLVYSIPGISLIGLACVAAAFARVREHAAVRWVGIWAALLFAGYILARNRLSEIEYVGRLQFFIMAGSLLVYLLFSIHFTSSSDRKRVIHWLLGLAAIQVAVAFYQFKEDNQWMPLPWAQRRDDFWRASGFFISPNHLAGYLEVMALFGFSLMAWGRYRLPQRAMIGYVAVSSVAGVAVSGSRGGYLSLLVGGAVVLMLNLRVVRRLRPAKTALVSAGTVAGFVALLAGVIALMFRNPVLRDRVIQINDPENMRWLLWGSAIEQFRLEPLFGTGGFSFLYFGRLFRDPLVQNDPIHVHNDYLQLLADYGMVGLGLFLVFLVVHVYLLRRGFGAAVEEAEASGRTGSNRIALAIGAAGSVSAYVVHSVFDFNMQIPVNALLMAAVFGIAANLTKEVRTRKVSVGTRIGAGLAPVLGLGVIVFGYPMIPAEFSSEQARVALKLERFREARAWAMRGVRSDPKNPDLYYYWGEAVREIGIRGLDQRAAALSEAVWAFEKGLEVFPKDSRLAVKLAQAHSDSGDYFSAAEAIGQAEELDPRSSLVAAYRGYVEAAGGYLDQAEAAFNESRSLGGEGAMVARSGLELLKKLRAAEIEGGGTPEWEVLRKTLGGATDAQQQEQSPGTAEKKHAGQEIPAKQVDGNPVQETQTGEPEAGREKPDPRDAASPSGEEPLGVESGN